MRELTRIFHVSDLHFIEEWRTAEGIRVSLDGAGDLPLRRAAVMKRRPCFRGAMGHDGMAVRDLEARWKDFHGGKPKLNQRRLFVFTGDLTAFGTERQFRDGLAFLDGPEKAGEHAPQRGCCLHHTGWREHRAILGNHDFFPGEPKWGRDLVDLWKRRPSPRGVRELERLKLPFVSEPISLGGVDLVILGVDTDANVWVDQEVTMRDPQFFHRMFARGDFPSQIEELGKQIAERAPVTSGRAQLRVLLLHHSIGYKGSRRFLRISADTQELLRVAIERFEIGVVLSGHIHEPQVNDLGGNTYEIRCGTTAQDQKSLPRLLETWTLMKSQLRDALAAWPELRATLVANFLREQKKENIYLEHSVSRANDGRIFWEVTPYTHHNRGGFKPAEGLMPRGPFTPRLARAA